jgi:hypothetical protein
MRMISICAYICRVKERLNLTIDGALLEAMKAYAASKEMSVSELVESYFRSVTKPVGRDNILDLVDRLEPPEDKGEEKFPKWKLLAANEERATVEAARQERMTGEAAKEGGGYGF